MVRGALGDYLGLGMDWIISEDRLVLSASPVLKHGVEFVLFFKLRAKFTFQA